ncbi:MAG: hypothetical protein PV362_11375 [Providencia heimbachae]|nr:hypothetical protein [Providencia heimbachae]
MILDKETLFSIDQAVTASAVATNVIDLTPVKGDFRDIGIGEPLMLFAQVTEQATAAGDAKVQIVLETSADKAFTAPVAIFKSLDISIADLNAGKRVIGAVPHGVIKYLRLRYVVTDGPLTAGKFMAGITLNVDAHPIYDAVTN